MGFWDMVFSGIMMIGMFGFVSPIVFKANKIVLISYGAVIVLCFVGLLTGHSELCLFGLAYVVGLNFGLKARKNKFVSGLVLNIFSFPKK